MFFTHFKSYQLPNHDYQVILFALKKHYDNVYGTRRGITFEFTDKNYITVWRKILNKHIHIK